MVLLWVARRLPWLFGLRLSSRAAAGGAARARSPAPRSGKRSISSQKRNRATTSANRPPSHPISAFNLLQWRTVSGVPVPRRSSARTLLPRLPPEVSGSRTPHAQAPRTRVVQYWSGTAHIPGYHDVSRQARTRHLPYKSASWHIMASSSRYTMFNNHKKKHFKKSCAEKQLGF